MIRLRDIIDPSERLLSMLERRCRLARYMWRHTIATDEYWLWYCSCYEWGVHPTHWWAKEFLPLSRDCCLHLLLSAPLHCSSAPPMALTTLASRWLFRVEWRHGQSKPIGVWSWRICLMAIWNYPRIVVSFCKLRFHVIFEISCDGSVDCKRNTRFQTGWAKNWILSVVWTRL